MKDKGYVQVYTGNGKGKTTASLGLSLRAVCAGYKVFYGQFTKGMDYSELKAAEFLKNFELKQYGRAAFIHGKPIQEDIDKAREGLREIKEKLISGEYDLVVCDELNIALFYNLISVEDVIDLIESKPEHTELIITGRYAKDEILERADLVTEMREIKHYYRQGVMARKGIEA